MNFPTAADEVETHNKFQLSIVYHLLLFTVGVRRLPRSRFLASAMLSKDSTRTELGKRPIPTRRAGDNCNTITCRRSLLSRKPNSYHRGNGKDKHEDNLVSHSLLLFGYYGNIQVTSSRAETDIARPDQGRVAYPPPPSFFFTTPYSHASDTGEENAVEDPRLGAGKPRPPSHPASRLMTPLILARGRRMLRRWTPSAGRQSEWSD